MSLRLNKTTIGSIESICMTNIPLTALAPEYRLALASKVSVVDTAGNSYVSSRLLVQFLLGADCKRIDKQIYDKQFASMKNDNGDSEYKDLKGRL